MPTQYANVGATGRYLDADGVTKVACTVTKDLGDGVANLATWPDGATTPVLRTAVPKGYGPGQWERA